MERLSKFRRMRVDTTVVETNIHYATDSSLLGDEVRCCPAPTDSLEPIPSVDAEKRGDRKG
jgi:IS5 family transposase